MGRYITIAQLALCVCACLAYLCEGDWGRALYWGSAALITVAITFLI